jgi:hypothetical protein
LIRDYTFHFPFQVYAMDAEISSDVALLIFRNDNKAQPLFLSYQADE